MAFNFKEIMSKPERLLRDIECVQAAAERSLFVTYFACPA